MLRTICFSTVWLLAATVSAHAEPICDISKRWEAGGLKDGAQLTISGRITDQNLSRQDEGMYAYWIEDSCPVPAFVVHNRPINCRGQVTITGSFDDEETWQGFGAIHIWVTSANCK